MALCNTLKWNIYNQLSISMFQSKLNERILIYISAVQTAHVLCKFVLQNIGRKGALEDVLLHTDCSFIMSTYFVDFFESTSL